MLVHNSQQVHRRTMLIIALFEVTKGLVAIIASLALLNLTHQNVRHLTALFISYFHLDSDAHYFKIFFDYTDLLSNENIHTAVLLTWVYAAIRVIEGYGLWKSRAWAEWLAAVSGGIYLPIEISHLVKHTNAINAAVLITNSTVVAYMLYRLWRRSIAKSVEISNLGYLIKLD
jgi:uncharacterized membrane protein (DUF2068 family)